MVTERHDSVIGVKYEGQEGVRRYLDDLRQIAEVSARVKAGAGTVGSLGTTAGGNPNQIRDAINNTIRQAVAGLTEAANVEQQRARMQAQAAGGGGAIGGGGSIGTGGPEGDDSRRRHEASQNWVQELEKRAAQMRANPEDPLANLRRAATRTAERLEQTILRGEIPFGQPADREMGTVAGFRDESARDTAYLAAREAERNAAQRLTAAETKLAQEAEEAARVREASVAEFRAAQRREIAAMTAFGNSARGPYSARYAYLQQQQAAAVPPGGVIGGGGGGLSGSGGSSGGFLSNFGSGFRGNPDRSYAEQLGQTFRFSVFYGAAYKLLFALTQTLTATLQEGIAFQDGMTDLSIATGRSKDTLNELADRLGQSATRAGFAPSQGLEIGARAIGLYGATDGTRSEQARVAEISSRVVNQLAVGAKKSPVELQGDIAAIVQALGGGAESQYRIADLDAFLTKKFGAAQGSTFETLAQSGSVGKAAGFSDEQLFAMAAQLISRTGQTPTAVGGYLAQIFSRGGEGSLVDVAKKVGIDPKQSVAEILNELAPRYAQAVNQGDFATQGEISAAFGRGKVQNAAVALLQDYSEVLAEAENARAEAVGSADARFQEHMDNIGGQLEKFGGEFLEFAGLLSQSGLLDVLGLTVITFTELLGSVNEVLRGFNELPGVIRAVIIAGGAAAVLQRTGAGAGILGALAARGGARPGGTSLEALLAPYGPAGAGAVGAGGTIGGASAGAAGAAVATSASTVARGLLRTLGPIALAVGGLEALGEIKASTDDLKAAQAQASATLRDVLGPDATASEFGARASAIKTDRDALRDARGGFANVLKFGTPDEGDQRAERLGGTQDYYTRAAAFLAAREDAARATQDKPIIDDFREVGTVLDELATMGVSSAEQMNILASAIAKSGEAASTAAADIDSAGLGLRVAEQAAAAFQGVIDASKQKNLQVDGVDVLRSVEDQTPIKLADYFAENYDPEKVNSLVRQKLDELGVRKTSDLSRGDASEIATAVVDSQFGSIADSFGGDADAVRQTLLRQIRDYVFDSVATTTDKLNKGLKLTGEEATAFIEAAVGASTGQLDTLADRDFSGRGRVLARLLRQVTRANESTRGGATSQGIEEAARIRREIVQNTVDELEALRQVALRNARSRQQAVRESRRFINRQVRAIVNRGGDADQLAAVIGVAGRGAIDVAREAIRQAIEVIKAAENFQNYLGTAGAGLVDPVLARLAAARQSGLNSPELRRLQSLMRGLRTTVGGTTEGEISTYTGSPRGQREEERRAEAEARRKRRREAARDRDTPGEIDAARAAAYAARTETDVDDARAAVQAAKVRVAQAKKGTVEYWNAIAELNSARSGLSAALAGDGSGADEARARREERAQAAAAKRAAYATRNGGDMAAARAAIFQARTDMRLAEKGTAEYYSALSSYFAARQQLTEAVQAYRLNRGLLRIDATNPLKVAQVEARAAAAQLRADLRANRGADVIASDRVDLRAARANAEATRFSQRLEATRTAQELGRISHVKYLEYLDSERDRLQSIKKRTFQQQQQLNEIEMAIKEAGSSLEGQFNLGDISVPTPYQVRRQIESMTQAIMSPVGAVAGSSTSTTTIYVDGADTGKVIEIVERTVGKVARVSAPSPRKR